MVLKLKEDKLSFRKAESNKRILAICCFFITIACLFPPMGFQLNLNHSCHYRGNYFLLNMGENYTNCIQWNKLILEIFVILSVMLCVFFIQKEFFVILKKTIIWLKKFKD